MVLTGSSVVSSSKRSKNKPNVNNIYIICVDIKPAVCFRELQCLTPGPQVCLVISGKKINKSLHENVILGHQRFFQNLKFSFSLTDFILCVQERSVSHDDLCCNAPGSNTTTNLTLTLQRQRLCIRQCKVWVKLN